MSEWTDIVKGGAAVGGVVTILHALRYFVPRNGSYQEKFQKEIKNDPRIRDYIAEVRDDRIIKCLEGIERRQEEGLNLQLKLLRNIRDIAADTARSRGISVHYDE